MRAKATSSLVLTLALLFTALQAYAATPPKPGAACSKVSSTQIYKGKKYTCIKVGKKLIWSKGVAVAKKQPTPSATPSPISTPSATPSPISTPSATPSPISTPSPTPTVSPTLLNQDAVTLKFQNVVNKFNPPARDWIGKTVAIVEDGLNGVYPEIAKESAEYSLKFYKANGFEIKLQDFNLILGRTQSWMQEKAKTYAPGCVTTAYKFEGNAALCSGNWATVYSHMPTAVTSWSGANDNIDLTNYKRPTYWIAMPHELWHVYQGYWHVQKSYRHYWAPWFGEGSAVMMSHLAYASYMGDDQYFLKLNIASDGSEGWGKDYCNRPLENARAVCEYTQGFLAMKFFITKYGFEIFRNIHTLEGPKDFQERFELATGDTLANFYSEVNQYLNSLGWGGSPVPTPKPTPTPSLLENWEKLRQDVQTRYLERSKSGRFFDFEFILSPTVNRAKAQETMDAYREASRNWTWLFEPTGTYSIVWVLLTEKDYDWWYAKVTELQGKNSIYPWDKAKNEFGHCGLSDQAFCGYGNTQEAPDGKMKLFQYNVIGSNFQGKPVANTVHHESVHFYQLANNLTYPRDLPCWYIEGQATFYGNVISRTNDSSYERSRIIASLPNSRNWTVAEWVDFLKSIQGNRDECLKDSRNYSIGSFLWEYLLLNYTEEDLHKAHIALKTKTWADVALSVLRKSADQLATEFANHLTTIFSRK